MPGLIHALALPDTGFISLVGGGGKSTLLLRLARERQARGLRTVVTTTTRILRAQGEAAGPVAGDLPALEAALAQSLTVCAALPAPELGKLAPPSQALLDQALNLAGLVVAEADGAHGRPVKAPAGYEPCLLPHSAAVVAVAGLSALGRPLEEVCHRPELAARLLGWRWPGRQRRPYARCCPVFQWWRPPCGSQSLSRRRFFMLIVIKGAGDLATGIACRLYQSGFQVLLTEIAQPTTVRCTVAFSQAVYRGEAEVEGIRAILAGSPEEALTLTREGRVAVLTDPEASCVRLLRPAGVVDAILAKQNLGTTRTDAPVVVGVGPGFTPGVDCHAAVETQRGHNLGRVLLDRPPAPNTGIPGEIGGYTVERLLRAPADGRFQPVAVIGETVTAGQVVAYVAGVPITAEISGVLRGLLPEGTPVFAGMKSGDVDPRCQRSHCFSVSDKARAVGGGVLEALLCGLKARGLLPWSQT